MWHLSWVAISCHRNSAPCLTRSSKRKLLGVKRAALFLLRCLTITIFSCRLAGKPQNLLPNPWKLLHVEIRRFKRFLKTTYQLLRDQIVIHPSKIITTYIILIILFFGGWEVAPSHGPPKLIFTKTHRFKAFTKMSLRSRTRRRHGKRIHIQRLHDSNVESMKKLEGS